MGSKTIKLKKDVDEQWRSDGGYWREMGRGCTHLCATGVSEWFSVPNTAKLLDITISTKKPRSKYHELRYDRNNSFYYFFNVYGGTCKQSPWPGSLDALGRNLREPGAKSDSLFVTAEYAE